MIIRTNLQAAKDAQTVKEPIWHRIPQTYSTIEKKEEGNLIPIDSRV
jgi:hypothetical protein